MPRVDQPRPPGTPIGLPGQDAPNANAPARNVPPAHPAPERPTGILGGLIRHVPGYRSGRPRVPPTVGASPFQRSTALRPYRDVLAQWQRHYNADRSRWHSAWRQANRNDPQVETRTARALKTTADMLEDATLPGRVALELHSVPLPQFPDQAYRLSHLQHMTINAAGLMELPDAMQQFSGLETLTLAHNPLDSLPASIASLSRLRELSILSCPELKELPERLASTNASGEHEGLVNLQKLQLVGTGITSLPASITGLQNLKTLQIRNSPLSTLAPAIHRMPRLEELDLEGCTALSNYPPIFGGGAALKRLNLKDCSNLRTLPLDIHRLTQLEELDLRGCDNLSRLPSSIARLPASCTIRVPPRLQAELDRLRLIARPAEPEQTGPAAPDLSPPGAGNQASASSSATTAEPLRTAALERIEDTAQTMLSTVIDEERNPFLEGAPSYLPENRPPDAPTTFGQIPALQKMLEESRDPHFLRRVIEMAGPSPRVEDPSEEGLSRHYANVSNWKAQKSAHLGIVDPLGQYVYHAGSQLDAATLAKAIQMWKTRELIVNAHPQDRARFPAFTLHIPEQVSDGSEDERQTSPEPSGHQ
ncbi:hypothetical protein HG421_12915 [Xanthomonas campestris pv. badrii]|uniref:Type III effector Xcv3220-like C-terminal domain-containing protein n=1 Tax=Xanthomonas campestris pv. badrii TaxID=149696 RepID=A0A7Z2VBE0_XANCA|nr:type III secretion system leucine-rich repeat domain-containing effector XopL [Xanthomonas campestris]QJD68515.1 hypothetical protein HG421_12915 [Xanthomonas campestris pv. badrii]